jgi:hypothetical protein
VSESSGGKCRWMGRGNPRAIIDRHEDDCQDDRCRGCLPCPKTHCVVCGIEHVEQQTCPSCISNTREDIAEIVRMDAALPAQTLDGGNDGKLEAAREIPGGEAMVMLGPGAKRGEIGKGEHITTLLLLVGWEDDWRHIKHHHTDDPATVEDAAKYLDEHLHWAAQEHPAFDAIAEELRGHRAHLEDVLHDGERADTGAPCVNCGRPLERIWAEEVRNDSWWCERCKDVVSPAEYDEAVARDGRRFAAWLIPTDMEAEYRIPRGSLTSWAAQGHVRKRKDVNIGRMVYNVEDAVTRRDALAKRDDVSEVG